jgi:uracil-DNA glycosylase family 4
MNKKLKVKPFFFGEELSSVSLNVSQDSICLKCGLFKNCKSPKMPVSGEGRRETLIIAEAPGKDEDERNIQLIGDAGQFLRNLLKERGLDLDKDFWKTNSVICRPPNNRKPTRAELKLCRMNYEKVIQEKKPKFIWLVGAAAIESYFQVKFSDEEGTVLTPTRWRGLCVPDKESGAWVIPIFHPSYAMRNKKDDLIMSQYERDLDFAISCMKKRPPQFLDYRKRIVVYKDFKDVCDLLDSLISHPPEFMAYDYETTGLKPYNKGHKIASISLCFNEEVAYSFPLEYPHFTSLQVKQLKEKWKAVLENSSFKIAHNLKYEDVWSRIILNAMTQNWHWCTMNAAHILDNRPSFSGLKFQTFIRWGVEPYDKSVSSYLKDKTGSGFNNVMKADIDELLLYNGLDSLFTFMLYLEQFEEMTPRLKESNDFFIDGLLALSDVQVNGIPLDRSYYEQIDKELERQMIDIYKNLLSSKEAKKFKEVTGREISFTSDHDLRELFFKILKCTPSKETDGGLPSVDAESIRALGSPIADQLVQVSKLEKIKGTYVGQFLRELNDDGKLHPFFNLHTVQTFRSSAQGPNWQNIPVRDADAKKYTRSGIFPSPGNIILDFDYGALEVRIIGAVTQDKKLVSYINDPTTDMHRDKAMELFVLRKEQVTKMIRFHAKNGVVFPFFYGSWYRSCAEGLWDVMKKEKFKLPDGTDLFQHLFSQKIIAHTDDLGIIRQGNKVTETGGGFTAHVKRVEQKFWRDFSGVKKWQEGNWAFYKKYGYIELVTGFRCSGYMKRNDLANYPIQGPAFHCLLWSLIEINKELKKRNMKTTIIGQIHDCCLFDCYPPEKELVKKLSIEIATQRIRKEWVWLNVPLILEFEETPIDGSWYGKKEIREE